MVKHTRLTQQQRTEMSDKHKRSGNIERLATQYNISRDTVRRWVREGQKSRPNWSDQPGRGRKPLLSSIERAAIRRSATHNGTLRKITSNINKKRTVHVSLETVRRALVTGPRPLQYSPVSTSKVLRPANKKQRVDFCTRHQRAHTKKWVYLDSKYFYLYRQKGGYHHYSWSSQEKTDKVGRSGAPVVLHVYAAVAHDWKSKLHFVPPTPNVGSKQRKGTETFKGPHYLKVMKELERELSAWCPSATQYRFIRDRAKQHTSHATNKALESINLHIMDDYPAQCWDINIIENVWGVLDTKLLGARARTPDGWRRAVTQAWNDISQSTINKLVAQVRPRMQKILEKDGAWLGKA